MLNSRLGAFGAFDDTIKKLIIIRGLRSLGQGAMVVDLTLYLKDLKWSGAAIGGVTSAAGLVGAALILFVGVMSDKKGRRPFLLAYEFLTMAASVAASLSTQALVLVLAVVVAGFGRGQSGAAGPFSPAEQAWLARHVSRENRGPIFSLNNAVGFIGMAIGALIGGVPALIPANHPIVAYRPVFLLVGLISLICFFILFNMREVEREPDTDGNREFNQKVETKANQSGEMSISQAETKAKVAVEENEETRIRKQENVSMLKLALVNSLNGLAVGLTGPMIAYWFSVRYGAGTAAIGATLSVGFLMTGISSIFNGLLAQKVGMVKSVTWMRVIGSGMMLILPWMPNFAAASFLYVIRGAINRGTQGNRSALSASLTRDQRRGLATSINALSMRLPSSIGPTLTGYMFDASMLAAPLILTASLQLVNAGLYQWMFGQYDGSKKETKTDNAPF